MMDRDLDRLIDRAAEQLIGHEPSRALTDAVMSRIAVPGRRYSRWVAPAVAAATIVVVVLLFVPRALRTDSMSIVLPVPPPVVVVARELPDPPIEIPSAARVVAFHIREQSPVARPMPMSVSMVAATNDTNSTSPDEPIDIQRLTQEPIDVEPLAIEPLVIEPLASND